ncbi:hypothetical protein KAT92_06640 [Candidatus Babeliales bacterium]|nr:hypothetical protein [Candidatus Babeliales bacterium]
MNRDTKLEEITRDSRKRYVAIHEKDPRKRIHVNTYEETWWINVLLPPITEALSVLSGEPVYTCGPHGLGAKVSVSIGGDKEAWPPNSKGYLVLCPLDLSAGEMQMVNFDINTGEYAPGTIGSLNGLNNPNEPLPETIGELLDIALRAC